jgi:hypothetical protein
METSEELLASQALIIPKKNVEDITSLNPWRQWLENELSTITSEIELPLQFRTHQEEEIVRYSTRDSVDVDVKPVSMSYYLKGWRLHALTFWYFTTL